MNTTDLTKTNQELEFPDEQVELMKRTVAKGATDDEFRMFLHQAKKSGLDPLAKQIYFVKRGTLGTIQTGIDGFRVIAQRSNEYAGQDEPKLVEENGKLISCAVGVYKFAPSGERYLASVGVAYYSEYIGQTPLWTKMPRAMLSKCAEALALRKAFPQDLSGIYTAEEMDQAEDTISFDEVKEIAEPRMNNYQKAKAEAIGQAQVDRAKTEAGNPPLPAQSEADKQLEDNGKKIRALYQLAYDCKFIAPDKEVKTSKDYGAFLKKEYSLFAVNTISDEQMETEARRLYDYAGGVTPF